MCLLQTTFPKVKKQNKIQTNWFVWNWKCFSLWVAFREKISRVVSSHSEENVGRRKMQILHTCMDNSKKIVTNHVNAWVTHVLLLAVSSYQKNVPELPTSNKTFTGWLFYINKPKRWNTSGMWERCIPYCNKNPKLFECLGIWIFGKLPHSTIALSLCLWLCSFRFCWLCWLCVNNKLLVSFILCIICFICIFVLSNHFTISWWYLVIFKFSALFIRLRSVG